ncbi:site-specific integrase [Streptacidiphilus fuscans]|uniref:hypothetical protein n=1 Tax=Streptacidiphilus fuscans TaxID=2789292 RepID=UPI001F489638|nr:hypothetical protein [Streptacidiphilus fuscans]
MRWVVAGQEFTAPFKTSALADAERSKLVHAMSKGEAFDITSGLPVSSLRNAASETTWYAFATDYVDANWKRWSANNRESVAKTFTAVTLAALRTPPPDRFDQLPMRTALREFAFNSKRRSQAPDDMTDILTWVDRNSSAMSTWTDSERVEAIVTCIDTKLNGDPCAKSSVKRHRRVLNPAMKRAVAKRILPNNPLPKLATGGGKSTRGLDKRCLINPEQAGLLLGWVHTRPRGGSRLHAFFATMYYCGLRPEEAVALRVHDATLPETGWGEVIVHTATPEVGSQWSTSG